MPREMTKKDIDEVVEKFKIAAKRVDVAGFDFIEIHGAHGYQIPAGKYIKHNAKIPVIVGGLITTAKEGTQIIESNRWELVFIGRELLRDPNWLLNEAKNNNIKLDYLPKQYERGF